jgi:hypothetical protein
MGNLDDFIEKRGKLVMTLFIVVQTVMFIAYLTMFILTHKDWLAEVLILVCVSMIGFLGFMIHFAYHSVNFI